MAAGPQRITNGHRAAVCALVIAGLSMIESCRIVGAPYLGVKAVLPKDWHKPHRRPHRWKGDALMALRAAWHDRSLTTAQIATRFGVTATAIQIAARKRGWERRKRARITDGTNVTSVSPEQRRLFIKLRNAGLSHEASFAEAVR